MSGRWQKLHDSLMKTGAQFVDPLPAKIPDRVLNRVELISAVRQAMAAEQEAAHQYETVAAATDDSLVAEVLREIAREERVHVGEFQQLLEYLDADEAKTLEEGRKEVRDKMKTGAACLMGLLRTVDQTSGRRMP